MRLMVAARPASVARCELCLFGPTEVTEAVQVRHVDGPEVTFAACERCARAARRIAAAVGQDADRILADVDARPQTAEPVPRRARRLRVPPELIREYVDHIVDANGVHYAVRAYGQPRTDGTWLAWLEFVAVGAAIARRTGVETTQPDRVALEHWAEGLEPIYFEGAFDRSR